MRRSSARPPFLRSNDSERALSTTSFPRCQTPRHRCDLELANSQFRSRIARQQPCLVTTMRRSSKSHVSHAEKCSGPRELRRPNSSHRSQRHTTTRCVASPRLQPWVPSATRKASKQFLSRATTESPSAGGRHLHSLPSMTRALTSHSNGLSTTRTGKSAKLPKTCSKSAESSTLPLTLTPTPTNPASQLQRRCRYRRPVFERPVFINIALTAS